MTVRSTDPVPISRPAFVPPSPRPEWVDRPAILDRLSSATDARLVLVDAPVGYGKTTLLAQWAQVDRDKTFVWLSLERSDSDPVRLLTHLIRAFETAGLSPQMPELVSPGQQSADEVVSHLLDELDHRPEPISVVLDDYHLARGQRVHQLVARLIRESPAHVQVVLGTRADPPFQLARLRATGELCEVRVADLEFDATLAAVFLANMGIALEPDQIGALVERAEGWPAGLYLAALALKDEPDTQHFIDSFAGSDRNIADYLSEEVLARLRSPMRDFLVHTSILDRLSGPVCDAVMGAEGSQAILGQLQRSNLFVVALDETGDSFRYHHLFGQMLQADLARRAPALRDELHRRASAWFEGEGWYDEAINHAIAGRDLHAASELIADHWLTFLNRGQVETIRAWLDDMGSEAVDTDAAASLTAGWVAALSGQPEEMEYFLGQAERLPAEQARAQWIEGRVALVRGLFGFSGLQDRHDQLARAQTVEPPGSVWQSYLSWGLGHVALLSGDDVEAVRRFREANHQPLSRQPVLAMITLAEHAVAELELGNLASAESKAKQAMALVEEHGLRMDTRSSSALLALGLVAVAQDDLVSGQRWLEDALRLRRTAGRLSPWPTLEVLLALAPVRYQMGAGAEARELVDEARALLAEVPDAGALPARLAAVERATATPVREIDFGQRLTERELLILRMLDTHGSSREIGAQLYLSVNTVKTHTRSIYRKLGVSSRRGALERAQSLDLL